ncbi:MAG TPA: SDR family oxidoreductase [Acidisarcina sp.]
MSANTTTLESPPKAQQQSWPGTDAELQPRADHGEESYQGHGRLKGKAALITGGDSGIGRAVAIAFAKEGADVSIVHLPEEEDDARETLRHIKAAGRKGLSTAGDIRDQDTCRKLIEDAVSEFGKLDILVNNAAFQRVHKKIEEFSAEEFDRTYRTNVFATFYLSQAALAHMKPGGSIINTTSIEAYTPEGSLLAYASTKAAIANFTKGLSKIAIEKGVRVNAVAPGPIWTPLIPSTMPPDQVESFGQSSLFKRPAQPAELAPVYVLLASDEASYISGEVYGVTGGRMPL